MTPPPKSTMDDDGMDDVCPNCGGEGYVYDCFEEYACVDPESGCDLCMRRCDWCNPRKPKQPDADLPDKPTRLMAVALMVAGITAQINLTRKEVA